MIDLYQFHRPDPDVPVRGVDRRAQGAPGRGQGALGRRSPTRTSSSSRRRASIVDVASVQNQLALDFTSPVAKGEVAFAAEHGLAFLPWSPLGGIGNADGTPRSRRSPTRPRRTASRPQQVVLAWLLALSPTVIPIPGSSRPETITDSAARGRAGAVRRRGARRSRRRWAWAEEPQAGMRPLPKSGPASQWRHAKVDVERRDLLRARQRAGEAVLGGEPQDRAVPPAQRQDGDRIAQKRVDPSTGER